MQLVIHAGIHRTGTTSLQRALARNRAALLARGVAYPGEAPNHQALAWELVRGKSGAREVLALVEAAGAPRVVLSGEDFAIHEDLGWLAAVAARHDVRVVIYLRRQDHWLMSWYNQHVKWPFDREKSGMDPQAFLATLGDFHWLDYEKLLGRWSAVLGQEGVEAAVLEKGQVEDATPDFLARAGIDPEGLDLDAERVNDSLPVHMLEIARHLGLHELKGGKRTRVLNALREGLADRAPPGRVTTVYSPEERNRVLARFEASNRAAARRFLGREALFLEPPPGPDAPYWRFPELSRDALIDDWVAPVIRALLG
ncbi:MAG TPA: hypothetical protein VM891_03575 [Amaricoccus sp.]|nr:hypothetical protein [Amaricoccus sp.]